MNEELNKYVTMLTHQLDEATLHFLNHDFPHECGLDFVLNTILSSYISSLSHMMVAVCGDNLDEQISIEKFISSLQEIIIKTYPTRQAYSFTTEK